MGTPDDQTDRLRAIERLALWGTALALGVWGGQLLVAGRVLYGAALLATGVIIAASLVQLARLQRGAHQAPNAVR